MDEISKIASEIKIKNYFHMICILTEFIVNVSEHDKITLEIEDIKGICNNDHVLKYEFSYKNVKFIHKFEEYWDIVASDGYNYDITSLIREISPYFDENLADNISCKLFDALSNYADDYIKNSIDVIYSNMDD